MAEAPPVKPGLKTTEFWITVAAMVLPALWGALPGPLTAGLAAVYLVARTVVKLLGPHIEGPK